MGVLDGIIIVSYFVGLFVIAWFIRKARSFEDFARGSQKIPASIVFASLSATIIGPGYSMGLINKAGTNGYVWLMIFLAFTLQTILVGYFIAPKLRNIENAYTLGDVMGNKYGNLLKLISGFLSVLLCIGFVGAIAKASGDLISGLTSISFVWAVILSTFFVILYSTFGGMKTVVITDTIQFIVLALVIPSLLIFMGEDKGIANLVESIPSSFTSFSGGFSTMHIFSLALGFFLGETLIPPYTNRALIAKSSKAAKRGFVASGVYSIFWFIVCTSIGVIASGLFPEGDNLFISVITAYLPVGLFGLAIAALISIIMSSQDSLLNAASVSLHHDILSVLFKRKYNITNQLKITRRVNVFIGLGAIVFAINVPGIIEALLYCYTLWAPTIVLPLVLALVYPRAKPMAALCAILLGLLVTAIWEWGLNQPYGIPSLLVGVFANQLAFWTTQLFLPHNKKINI